MDDDQMGEDEVTELLIAVGVRLPLAVMLLV